MDVGLSELPDLVKDRVAWRAANHGWQRIGQVWVTELEWTDDYVSNKLYVAFYIFFDGQDELQLFLS